VEAASGLLSNVRHSARASQVAYAADPKAGHSRRGDSAGRLHLDSLVAPRAANPPHAERCSNDNHYADDASRTGRRIIIPPSILRSLRL
jgi:hypothetical protein